MMSSVMQQQTMGYPPTMMSGDAQGQMIMSGPIEHGQFMSCSSSDVKNNACYPRPSYTSDNNNITIKVNSDLVTSETDVDENKDTSEHSRPTSEVSETVNTNTSELLSPGKLDSPGSDSGLGSTTSSTEDHSTNSNTNSDVQSHNKLKGKKKYYMYGNLKLVKPIKDIPPRFQMLLAETSAAKARCEGQPIYQQHMSESQMIQHDTELNANARCFVPMQSMPAMPCTMSSGGGLTINGSQSVPIANACYPPPNYVMGSAAPVPVHSTNVSKTTVASASSSVAPVALASPQSNGGGTCYYVYSSSSGYSSFPPPPPGAPQPPQTAPPPAPPTLQQSNQAPIVYMMNAPYPAQPCPSYPALQPVHGYGMCSATAQ